MNNNNNKEMVTRGSVWNQAWFRVHCWLCVTHTGQWRRCHSCSCWCFCLHYSVALFLCQLIETNKKLIFFPLDYFSGKHICPSSFPLFCTFSHIHSNSFSNLTPEMCWHLSCLILWLCILRLWSLFSHRLIQSELWWKHLMCGSMCMRWISGKAVGSQRGLQA